MTLELLLYYIETMSDKIGCHPHYYLQLRNMVLKAAREPIDNGDGTYIWHFDFSDGSITTDSNLGWYPVDSEEE